MVELTEQEETWLRFAKNGDVMGAFNIGKFYSEKKLYDEAKKWLKVVAEQGHLGGIFKYGELLLSLKEIDEAKIWLGKASSKGHSKAKELFESLK